MLQDPNYKKSDQSGTSIQGSGTHLAATLPKVMDLKAVFWFGRTKSEPVLSQLTRVNFWLGTEDPVWYGGRHTLICFVAGSHGSSDSNIVSRERGCREEEKQYWAI